MKPKTTAVSRTQNSRSFQGEGPNWVLIAGGALLSTLSIRLGYKLKQAIDTKQHNANNGLKGLAMSVMPIMVLLRFLLLIFTVVGDSRKWQIPRRNQICCLPHALKCLFLHRRRWHLF